MTESSLAVTERIVHTIADVSLENEHYFAELDGVVGDGDFGISLANGFRKLMRRSGRTWSAPHPAPS